MILYKCTHVLYHPKSRHTVVCRVAQEIVLILILVLYITILFLLQKRSCQFLIGPSSKKWHSSEED